MDNHDTFATLVPSAPKSNMPSENKMILPRFPLMGGMRVPGMPGASKHVQVCGSGPRARVQRLQRELGFRVAFACVPCSHNMGTHVCVHRCVVHDSSPVHECAYAHPRLGQTSPLNTWPHILGFRMPKGTKMLAQLPPGKQCMPHIMPCTSMMPMMPVSFMDTHTRVSKYDC